MFLKKYILICFLFLGMLPIYAQETKEDIEKKADRHFSNGEYIEATPLYLRLLSLEPRSHNYNYKYGACLLLNSKNKQSAFKYLNFAVSGGAVEDEAYYYLAKAFHLTYRFKKAIKNYEIYKSKAGSKALRELDVDRQIEMCKNGLNLLSNLTEAVVLKKQEIDIKSFFRIYDLSNIGGQIIVTENFQNRQDKRNNHVPVIHFPANSDKIFYSSYGDNNDNKDIYMRTRLPDGSWSLEQKVFGEVNTKYDEDFPYLHPNGRYLYFSSKGHNSMGGYDIFKSEFDDETNTFKKPENLDFPISSPDDDLLYIVDSLNRLAYFSSKRESEIGDIKVYNVRVERFPVQIAVIKGEFNSTIDPKNKEISIIVRNEATQEKAGSFETKKNGEYLITLPKGGKYEFEIKVSGKDKTYKSIVDVPYLKEVRPLKQAINETIKDNNEIVLISNKFDEEFDDPVAIMAEVIEGQSKMSVNQGDFDLDSLDQLREQKKALESLGLDNFSTIEIIQLADDKVSDITERLDNSTTSRDKALQTIANSKKVMSDAYRRADSLLELADKTTDPDEKRNLLRRSNQAKNTVQNQKNIIESAQYMAEFLEKDIQETEKKLAKAKEFQQKIHAVDKDDQDAFMKFIADNKVYVKEHLKVRTRVNAQFEYMSEIDEQLEEIEEKIERQKKFKKDKERLKEEIARLEEEIPNAKRRNKEALENELASKQNILSDTENEIAYLDKKIKSGEDLKQKKNAVLEINKTEISDDPIDDVSELIEESKKYEQKLADLEEKSTATEKTLPREDSSSKDDLTSSQGDISNSEKKQIINSVDENYEDKVNETQRKIRSGQATDEDLVEVKQEHKSKLEEELDKVNREIQNQGETTENKKKKAVLQDAISEVKDEIKSLGGDPDKAVDQALADISDSEKKALLNKIDKNYATEIKQLEDEYSDGKVSAYEVIQRKEKYQDALKEELEKVNKKIEKKGENKELLTEKAIIEEELTISNESLNELKQLQSSELLNLAKNVSESKKEDVLNEKAKETRIKIDDLEQITKSDPSRREELVELKKEYLSILNESISDYESLAKNNQISDEDQEKQAILKEERNKVIIEIDELEQSIRKDKEGRLADKKEVVENIEITSSEKEIFLTKSNNIEDLKKKLDVLNKLETKLIKLRNETTDQDELKKLDQQLDFVKNEKRNIEIQIGELEQSKDIVAEASKSVEDKASPKEKNIISKSTEKVADLTEEKELLIAEKENLNSERDKEKQAEKIAKVEEKIAVEETTILKETTAITNKIIEKEINQASKEELQSIENLSAKSLSTEANQLIREAEKTKDPIRKNELLKEAQLLQKKSLEQIKEDQEKRKGKVIIGDLAEEMNMDDIDPEKIQETPEKIEDEQIKIGLKLLAIDDQLKRINVALVDAKRKEKEELETKKSNLEIIRTVLIDKQEANKVELENYEKQKLADKNKGVADKSIKNPVTYEEEVEFAKSEEYRSLFNVANNLTQKQYELKVTEELLKSKKQELAIKVKNIENKDNPSEEEKEAVKKLIVEISDSEQLIETLRNEVKEGQEHMKQSLPSNARERNIAENLISREVDPISEIPKLPVMSTGLVLSDANAKTYSDENPIPIKPTNPKGLVFRVQIGAFSKPVPNETFNEFSPVTGEEVRPGLIRYMAGYFASRDDATSARNKIRTMGYDDAFLVAYCDGERIPIYRAEQLLASGACVPTITTPEQPILTAEEATSSQGDSFEAELDEFAYNKAPGAAEADVAESKMGLYYTVQVGVYNKPVSAEELNNISPLITKRLPNGQMRYSSGIFNDVPDARVKQQEAISLGITDAFIVAYFKGERITVSQARKLLEENGQEILELKNPTVVKRNKTKTTVDEAVQPDPEPYLKSLTTNIQFISKLTYGTYPTQVLHRYNQTEGLFYFDNKSGMIKSFLYPDTLLPNIREIEEEFEKVNYYKAYKIKDKDAVEIENAIENASEIVHVITANITFNDLNDDLFNLIIKTPLLKEISSTESGLTVKFYEFDDIEKLDKLQLRLIRFQASEVSRKTYTTSQID